MNKNNFTPFILSGHRKSGTSLFRRLFDNIDEINLYPVDLTVLYSYFPYYSELYKNDKKKLKKRLTEVIIKSFERINLHYNYFNISKIKKLISSNIDSLDLQSKKEVILFISRMWFSYTEKKNNSLPFMFKETSQSIYFKELKTYFKNLKMISLIRDPRDNYAALKAGVDKYYSKIGENDKKTLASLINRSRMDLKSSIINTINYPESFLAIKFENLIQNPKKEMKKVCKFLNIKFDISMIRPTFFGKPYFGNSHEGKKFRGISKSNLSQWKKRISPEEAMIIEFWLKDVMKDWNYKLNFSFTQSESNFFKFYNWYNANYFFNDPFKTSKK